MTEWLPDLVIDVADEDAGGDPAEYAPSPQWDPSADLPKKHVLAPFEDAYARRLTRKEILEPLKGGGWLQGSGSTTYQPLSVIRNMADKSE